MSTQLFVGMDWSEHCHSADSLLDISCSFTGNRLTMNWTYSVLHFPRSDIEGLAADFLKELSDLTRYYLANAATFVLPARQVHMNVISEAFAHLWERYKDHPSINGLTMLLVTDGAVN
jgi:hypothetical protein